MIAGIICFVTAFALGAGFWLLLGTKAPAGGSRSTTLQISNQNSAANSQAENNVQANTQNANVAAPQKPIEVTPAPAGEVKVTGGEVTLGGGDTNMPLRRVNVEAFSIGETEVTNAQYADFVEDTKHKAPADWKDGKFAPGTDDYPVVGITWADANDYCEWLSKKINAVVRLPSEAEWERAARGDHADYKYPWGSDLSDEDIFPKGAPKGKLFAVKSTPDGRSPFGAYEMSGNAWEWTSDLSTDEFGKPILYEKSRQRVIKGGSAGEKDKYLMIDARDNRPENMASPLLGFRYVIIREK